jgi:hypothetical protein
MQSNRDQGGRGHSGGKSAPATNLLKRIGWKGLFLVVWRSTPFPLRLIVLPYGLLVYRRLLAGCNDSNSLYTLHVQKFQSSYVFKLLRPRYHIVDQVLESLLRDAARPPPV